MTMDELKKDMEAEYRAAGTVDERIAIAGVLATIFQTEELIKLYADHEYNGTHFTRKPVAREIPVEGTVG